MLEWRGWRLRLNWRSFFVACGCLYVLTTPLWLRPLFRPPVDEMRAQLELRPKPIVFQQSPTLKEKAKEVVEQPAFVHRMKYKGTTPCCRRDSRQPNLRERLTGPKNASKKYIVSLSPFQQPNLGGCPDWNCEVTEDHRKADAFINLQPPNRTAFKGYVLLFQPVNYGLVIDADTHFNMTICFREDSPVSSPYGYTVRLAPESWTPVEKLVNVSLVLRQKEARRLRLVKKLQEYVEVDVFGSCSTKQCAKGDELRGRVEQRVSEDRLFADLILRLSAISSTWRLENSICQDYITEKLWSQGFQHTVVPIVLKRSIVEPFAPPHSFIAFDDYEDVEQMGRHLKQLMASPDEYLKFFAWREKYEVIFLDGLSHGELERPARILPTFSAWTESCEKDGELAARLLKSGAKH
ncbi:Glyco-tran-10-N domain-containing protein [Aphelenchoides fujianensis]|nr:Glyco-tran-10-N domain-containing protein [Aphelenchoides fujianensis]